MITFVRHMEVDDNVQRRFTAQNFSLHLNRKGIEEAGRMAINLMKFKFDAVFSSDQIRSVETAVILVRPQRYIQKFVLDSRLREVNVGALVGQPLSPVARPEFSTKHPNFDFRSVGGEAKESVICRQLEVIQEVGLERDLDEVLVVGHGTALRVLLEKLNIPVKLTRENFIRFDAGSVSL